MALALAFRRWDVDDFLNEIPNDLYEEWVAFSRLQPLDPAYVIMRGLMGDPENGRRAPISASGGWEQAKMNLIRHANITKNRNGKGKRAMRGNKKGLT